MNLIENNSLNLNNFNNLKIIPENSLNKQEIPFNLPLNSSFNSSNSSLNNSSSLTSCSSSSIIIGDITIKKRYWGCLICKSLKNNIKINSCSYCHTKRSQDRFIIKRKNIIYICKVYTEKVFPIVSIIKIDCNNSHNNNNEVYGKVKLRMTYDTLKESMNNAIDDFETEKFLSIRTSRETLLQEQQRKEEQLEQINNNNNNNKLSKEDLKLDLFHRVMKNGENYAYDGNIGQYVHIETLKNRQDSDQSKDNNIVRDLHYLKFMKREKHEMNKIVEETINRRNAEYIENVIDLTYDTLNEWKEKVPCSLCEYMFPPSQLLGTISLKTLITWREQHNVKSNLSEAKSSLNNIYTNVKLCIFCSQFFDTNFSYTLDVEAAANKKIKKQLKEKIQEAKKKEKETPVTKIQLELSIAELYNKKLGSIKQKILEVSSFLFF